MKKEITIEEQFRQAYADIEKCDRKIKRRHRYHCGLADEKTTRELGCGDLFFESPDWQNSELYYALRELGWINSGYKAPYHWGVSRGGIKISFVEGDVYVRNLKK